MPRVEAVECESCGRKQGEKHKATEPRPTIGTLEGWMCEGICEATDGCTVEPDGVCPHGHSSWLLVLHMI